MTKRVYNFSPGPAVSALSVLVQIQSEMPFAAGRRRLGARNPAIAARRSTPSWPKRNRLSGSCSACRELSHPVHAGGRPFAIHDDCFEFFARHRQDGPNTSSPALGQCGAEGSTKRRADPHRLDGKEHNYSYLPAFNELNSAPTRHTSISRRTKRSRGPIRRPARHRRGAADLRFVVRFPVPPDRRGQVWLIYACAKRMPAFPA